MKRLTAEEFEALLPYLGRMSLDAVQIAREVLVDGRSQIQVAKAHGLSRQRVSKLVARVERVMAPPGWERVEVWLPPELADQVRRMAAEAKDSEDSPGDASR